MPTYKAEMPPSDPIDELLSKIARLSGSLQSSSGKKTELEGMASVCVATIAVGKPLPQEVYGYDLDLLSKYIIQNRSLLEAFLRDLEEKHINPLQIDRDVENGVLETDDTLHALALADSLPETEPSRTIKASTDDDLSSIGPVSSTKKEELRRQLIESGFGGISSDASKSFK